MIAQLETYSSANIDNRTVQLTRKELLFSEILYRCVFNYNPDLTNKINIFRLLVMATFTNKIVSLFF